MVCKYGDIIQNVYIVNKMAVICKYRNNIECVCACACAMYGVFRNFQQSCGHIVIRWVCHGFNLRDAIALGC